MRPVVEDCLLDSGLAGGLVLTGWLARDPGHLAPSLEEFVGHPAYGLCQLRGDLERFVFLLGGSDGGPSSAPDRRRPGPAAQSSPKHAAEQG
jgi:hypothetical protein